MRRAQVVIERAGVVVLVVIRDVGETTVEGAASDDAALVTAVTAPEWLASFDADLPGGASVSIRSES